MAGSRFFLFLKGAILAISPWLFSCSSLLYHPTHHQHYVPAQFGVQPEELWIDGLHAWRFRATSGQPQGLVLFFHGNAENLTSHFSALTWLPKEGFDYLIFDYRGYGQSPGKPTPESTVRDGIRVIRWGLSQRLPLILFGQSLGGAVLQRSLQEFRDPEELKAIRLITLESSFRSYQKAGQKILSQSWITWPFQWISHLLLSDSEAPKLPLPRGPRYAILHGTHDRTISVDLGEELFHLAPEPKEAWVVPGGGHIQAFWMQTPNGAYPYREQWLWMLHEVTAHASSSASSERPEGLELELPFEVGKSFEVIQGPGGSFSHQGEQFQAIDFAMPEGTPVLAMRGGQVVEVVDHWSEGGPSDSLALKSNRILIEHSDGTLAEYLHFKKYGALVKKGERVATGSRIGLSGATGFASEPHLHVRINTPNGSVPMLFKTGIEFPRPLQTGQTITRPKN